MFSVACACRLRRKCCLREKKKPNPDFNNILSNMFDVFIKLQSVGIFNAKYLEYIMD